MSDASPRHIRLCQCNPTVGDIDGNAQMVLNALEKGRAEGIDLLVFPETMLSGYPADDLITRPAFIDAVMDAARTCALATAAGGPDILLGTPWCDDKDGHIYNASLMLSHGAIQNIVYKTQLPNYGVFDDKRVFTPAHTTGPISWHGHRLGVMICEDIWFDTPASVLVEQGAEVLIVQNASPYDTGKRDKRLTMLRQRVQETGRAICYLNQVGGQDDVVYDGHSVVIDQAGAVLHTAPGFVQAEIDLTLNAKGKIQVKPAQQATAIDLYADMYAAVTLGLRDYVRKNGFTSVLLGLSGGMDSAIVAGIAADALGPENVTGIMMPSLYTSPDSLTDAADIAARLGIQLRQVPITPVTDAIAAQLPLAGLAAENTQARVRGLMLMALSNQTGALLLSTGNKSEIACGYATLYGDMCGAYNPIKDIYKTEVYRLAAWRNTRGNAVFNDSLLHKEPSAELRDNQKDSDNLPPYDVLDAILYQLLEREQSHQDIIATGFAAATVNRVAKLVRLAEYKRRQSCPGPKISTRAFGRERRYPLTNLFTG
ncbi:MAG: NAD+ synthase [Pseudomonadota bacterium]